MKTFENIERAFMYFSLMCLVIMVFFMASEMSTRVGITHLFRDSYALVGFMMVGITYLGLSYIQKDDGHLKMTLLLLKLNEKNSNSVKIFYNFIEIAILILLITQTADGTWRAYVLGDTTTEPGAYLNWYIRAMVPLGLSVFCARIIIETVQLFAGIFQKSANSLNRKNAH